MLICFFARSALSIAEHSENEWKVPPAKKKSGTAPLVKEKKNMPF